jgi:RNA polymerase sigma-70 factor (ECF subfamily)
LQSYLYRLTADRNDAEDLVHDTFIQAFDKLSTFKGEASLKTWIFQIATNLARTRLGRRRRWTADVSARAKALVANDPSLAQRIQTFSHTSPYGSYEIKEHINTCFTCIGKNLPIENQVAVILREVYDFALADIGAILEKSQGTVKYLLQTGRSTMMEIFEARCALINKAGVCHQCSELNGWLTPNRTNKRR